MRTYRGMEVKLYTATTCHYTDIRGELHAQATASQFLHKRMLHGAGHCLGTAATLIILPQIQ